MPVEPRKAVEEFADKCIRCGLCARTNCGNFSEGTPCLGDICESLLSGSEDWRHFPFTCALCNRCTVKCPKGLHAIDACRPLRGMLLPEHPEIRPLYRKFRTDLKWNLFSSLKARNAGDIEKIDYIEGEPLGTDADHTAFFPGCALSSYQPELTRKVSEWLRDEGIAAYTLFFCCGATFYDPGFFPEFDEYRIRAQEFLKEHEITRLVFTCPHCGFELPELLEGMDVELVKLSDLLNQRGKVSDFSGRIAFQDACYDRATGIYGELARKLYPKATFVSLPHEGKESLCCGGGGLVSAYAFDYCVYRRDMRLAEFDTVDVDLVLSSCFSCVNSLQRGEGSAPVMHYLEPIFDVKTDWNAVYASVDALNADPAYAELTAGEDGPKTFE
ncbi:MAG: (Fe-S)-binding protein [Coriobacteriales bacterium]|jgi:fumarate reductase (CoM/CoB) subunit B